MAGGKGGKFLRDLGQAYFGLVQDAPQEYIRLLKVWRQTSGPHEGVHGVGEPALAVIGHAKCQFDLGALLESVVGRLQNLHRRREVLRSQQDVGQVEVVSLLKGCQLDRSLEFADSLRRLTVLVVGFAEQVVETGAV